MSQVKIKKLKTSFPKSHTKYFCVWIRFVLKTAAAAAVLSAIPRPEGLQMGSHTKKFDVIIIVSPFISPHD